MTIWIELFRFWCVCNTHTHTCTRIVSSGWAHYGNAVENTCLKFAKINANRLEIHRKTVLKRGIFKFKCVCVCSTMRGFIQVMWDEYNISCYAFFYIWNYIFKKVQFHPTIKLLSILNYCSIFVPFLRFFFFKLFIIIKT